MVLHEWRECIKLTKAGLPAATPRSTGERSFVPGKGSSHGEQWDGGGAYPCKSEVRVHQPDLIIAQVLGEGQSFRRTAAYT